MTISPMQIEKAYYKSSDQSAAARMLEGTVMVSSLEHYRWLQASWDLVGDPLEGAFELTVPRQLVATEGSSDLELLNSSGLADGLAKRFVHVESGRAVIVGQAPVSSEPIRVTCSVRAMVCSMICATNSPPMTHACA